jgi:hypothetical protein
LLSSAGLEQVEVWSVSVPVANALFLLGTHLVRRATPARVLAQSAGEQTATSGIRAIPFKTVFPPWFRFLMNRRTLVPAFWLQRRFYRSSLGLTLLGAGRMPA